MEKFSDNRSKDIEKTITEADEEVKTLFAENSKNELDALLHKANRAANDCILDNSWLFSVPAALLSIPLSVRFKTFTPLVFAAVSGSGLDYVRGIKLCEHHRENIKQIKLAIAMHDYRYPQNIDSPS